MIFIITEIQTLKIKEENNSKGHIEDSDDELSAEDEESDSDYEKDESDSEVENTPAKRSKLSILQNSAIFSPSTSYRITPQQKIAHRNVVCEKTSNIVMSLLNDDNVYKNTSAFRLSWTRKSTLKRNPRKISLRTIFSAIYLFLK